MTATRQPAQALGLKILSYADELPTTKPGKHSPLGDELAALADTIDPGQWACIFRGTPEEAKDLMGKFSGGLKGMYQMKIRQHEIWMTSRDTPKKLRVTVNKTPGAPKPLPPFSGIEKTADPVAKASVGDTRPWRDLSVKERQLRFVEVYRQVSSTSEGNGSARIAKILGITDAVAVSWIKDLRTKGLL
jgi:hypothetical protein